jgi:hypothetical protein
MATLSVRLLFGRYGENYNKCQNACHCNEVCVVQVTNLVFVMMAVRQYCDETLQQVVQRKST